MKRMMVSAAALAAVLFAVASPADAGPRLRFFFGDYEPDYRTYYPGPDYIPRRRHRYDDDYSLPDDDDDDLSGRRFYGYSRDDEDEYDDEDYYEPEYVPPKKKKKVKAAAKPSAKTAAKPEAKKKKEQQAQSLSCDKASEIVSGYGFTSVKSTSCKGPVYAFNASRDGKPFSIKMNSASGELTEVKKQK
jgi:hypothetical protein